MKNTTLVLGASLNPNRYSNIAIKRLRDKQIDVRAIGLRKGSIFDVVVENEQIDYKNIDTVSLYLNPERQEAYYDYILSLKPRRVIFNPGTENSTFQKILETNEVQCEVACTLVLLSTDQY